MTNDFEFYNLKTDPDATLNLWYLQGDDVESKTVAESERLQQIKRQVPDLKDELFNCKGVSCKPEISYRIKSGSRRRKNNKDHRLRDKLSRNSRQSKKRK